MAGKKRTRSDDITSQNDKRAKIKDTPAIKEEMGAFAPQPDVPKKIRVISPVKVSEKAKKAITPIAATTKEEHEDDINWSDDDSEIVDGANTESEAASEDYINIITGDEADTTLIGSEDDAEQVETRKIDGEEEPADIKYTDETAKPVSNSSNNDGDQKKEFVERDDTAIKEKVKEGAPKKRKTEEEEATKNQESNDEYSAEGRNIVFRAVETTLQYSDIAMWVGLGVVGATETRQITVDCVKVEVTVKLLEVKFDAPATKDSKEAEEIYFHDGAGNTILPTTEAPPKLTVDTAVTSKSRDYPATSQTASPAAPPTVAHGSKLAACRFGDECKKRATCMFNHSQPSTKLMCGFVNTNMGCSKGSRCTYSHEHEGQICRHGTVRKECPKTFKCAFLHMDDEPPSKADETSKFQVPDRPVVREPSAADIAERAAANRASREASAASAPPPNAPTGPKSNKRSRGGEDADTGVQAQRPRHNFQMPTYFGQQQLQPQQWRAMPGFASPPVQFTSPPGRYHSPQGQYIPAQVPYYPQQGFHNFGYAGNQQHGRGRGRGNGRTRGGGGGRGRGNARQSDRHQNGGGAGGTGEDHGIKVKGAAEGSGAGESGIKARGSAKKA